MFGRRKPPTPQEPLPEKLRYTKYYEYDGLLRANNNRFLLLSCVFGVIALSAVGYAVYLGIQPPTVIRVDATGEATVVGPTQGVARPGVLGLLTAPAAHETGPTDIEGKAAVRRFLERYLSYTPTTVDKQLADAVNMMTLNLRSLTLAKLRDDDTVGRIRDDSITSRFQVRAIEPLKGQPWTFQAFGVKEIHRISRGVERTDRIVGRYTVRLIQERRSERNPSGLLVAEFREEQMVGEKEFGLEQRSSLLAP